MQDKVVAYEKNQHIKPNAGLTDQLSANIEQIESNWFDFFFYMIFAICLLLIKIIWLKSEPNKTYIFFVCKLLFCVISPVSVIKNWSFVTSV